MKEGTQNKTKYYKVRWVLAMVLLLAQLVSGVPVWAVETETEDELGLYFYYMSVTHDGVDGAPIEMKLYACTTQADAEILEGASFGLRLPAYMGKLLNFQPSEQVIIQPVVPEARYRTEARLGLQIYDDSYHGFAWTRYVKAVDAMGKERELDDLKTWTPGAPDDSTEASPAKGHILIGTYTFDTKGSVPSASSVGQKDWEETHEAIAWENGETALNPEDIFNQTVWSQEKDAYIGYYMKNKNDATLGRTPLKLVFSPPKTWNGIFNVQSYDPKDPLTINIYPEEPAEGAPTCYQLVIQGEKEGTGLFVRTVRFAECEYSVPGQTEPCTDLPEGRYRLEIRKESHVRAELKGLTVRKTETVTELFPELEGEFLYLPCGDVNGDGEIRQEDRALLTAPANYGKAAVEGQVYDLDGDDRVDQTDLAILIAPANYGKSDFTVVYPKETGR